MGTVSNARQTAGQVTRNVRPWIITLAKIGFAVKGIVYLVLGILALQAAQGYGSTKIQQQDVLRTIQMQPLGNILMVIVVIGLFGYALWRLIEAIFDPEHVGTKGKAVLRRIGYFVSGIVYGGLGFSGYRLLTGKSQGGGGTSPQDITAKLMNIPGGTLLVGLVGAVIIAVGLYAFYQAWTTNFQKEYRIDRLRGEQKKSAIFAGRLGIAARGVVDLIIGGFLVRAALQHNPSQAVGLGEAFQKLAAQPFGTILLAIVALGLVAFGIYMIVYARYGRIGAQGYA